MAIKWRLDSHLGVAAEAANRGLDFDTSKDIDFIIKTFSDIIEQPIFLAILPGTANCSPYSNYTEDNGKNVIFVTESLIGSKIQSYSLISECMACFAECEDAPAEVYCNIIEQVFFEERDPKIKYDEYPQVQRERETDLGALEILFPMSERQKYATSFCNGSLNTIELANSLGIPTAVLERGLSESYMKYCIEFKT